MHQIDIQSQHGQQNAMPFWPSMLPFSLKELYSMFEASDKGGQHISNSATYDLEVPHKHAQPLYSYLQIVVVLVHTWPIVLPLLP